MRPQLPLMRMVVCYTLPLPVMVAGALSLPTHTNRAKCGSQPKVGVGTRAKTY